MVEGGGRVENREDQKTAEGSLEVKLPTVWTDGKAELGRVRQEKEEKKSNVQNPAEIRSTLVS